MDITTTNTDIYLAYSRAPEEDLDPAYSCDMIYWYANDTYIMFCSIPAGYEHCTEYLYRAAAMFLSRYKPTDIMQTTDDITRFFIRVLYEPLKLAYYYHIDYNYDILKDDEEEVAD